jgi:hypothetical protein
MVLRESSERCICQVDYYCFLALPIRFADFRSECAAYLSIIQSKNKALEHTSDSRGWALAEVMTLKVSTTLLLDLRSFLVRWKSI